MYECLKVGKEASQKMIQIYFQAQEGTGASKQNKTKQTNKQTNNRQTNLGKQANKPSEQIKHKSNNQIPKANKLTT